MQGHSLRMTDSWVFNGFQRIMKELVVGIKAEKEFIVMELISSSVNDFISRIFDLVPEIVSFNIQLSNLNR